jgi:hypothetical protein
MAWTSRSARWVVIALLLIAPRRAISARPDAPPAPAAGPDDKKAEAEAHYTRGKDGLSRRDFEAALAEFLLARQLYPLWNATYNAGRFMEELHRYDEALSMFEAVVREFGDAMLANYREYREEAQRKVTRLRELVGTIEIEDAEPGADIVIDGRDRGEYPALAPLRVGAGSHLVRVSKAGFAPSETRVDVAGRQVVRVHARLFALSRSGRLKVIEQGGEALDVLVDGSKVGKTPWDGQLAVGGHVVLLRGEGGSIGTPPIPVSIELDQTTKLTLSAEELSAQLRVEPVPVNASVAIDAVMLGRGVWEGRLRAGRHKVEVAAEGFLPETRQVEITRDQREILAVALQRDPSSPFSQRPRRPSRFIVELGEALVLVPSFGGDIAGGCVGDCSLTVGAGGHGILQGGYELSSGLSFGVMAGYLTATQRATHRQTTLQPFGLRLRDGLQLQDNVVVDDLLKLRGGLVGVWVGWSLFTPVSIHLRLSGGALLGSLEDVRVGQLAPNGAPILVNGDQCAVLHAEATASDVRCSAIGPVGELHSARLFYLAPEARVGLPLSRHVEVNLGLSLPILINPSPLRWGPPSSRKEDHRINAGSDGFGTFKADALLGSVLVLFAPGVGTRYAF